MAEDDSGLRRAAFGRALANALLMREVTQRDLGTKLGVAQSAIAAWKAGASEPAPETVFAVEAELELPAGQLSQHLGYFPPAALKRPPTTFEAVVIADDMLDEVMKAGLIAQYRAWTERRAAARRRRS